MGKRNEEAGGGGEIGEAGRGVWNGTEFRIHLQEMKFDDVQIRVTRKELTITERGSMNLITSSRLPRTASSHFSPFMQNGFLVLRFDRVSFAKKIWNVLVGGATLAGAFFGCVNDVQGFAGDPQRSPDYQRN
ncbi:hypothetical protein WN944_001112 [Citrus x changshan-huyou]|uniref:Uncharacterized protein n=1 Tax=Citrus x changshan-huyou TaxID=2935761 RepID=A0AAP0QQF0_9ROSI